MSERPILFSGPMVRAILEGRKTQTRRVAYIPPNAIIPETQIDDLSTWLYWMEEDDEAALYILWAARCPYGKAGDHLWVRETWCYRNGHMIASKECIQYKAEGFDPIYDSRWHPSIHMPRWASRLTLRITDVRVQRLQEITEDDAKAEGFREIDTMGCQGYARDFFQETWDKINGKRAPWARNPWVWALTFERVI